jgi:hypothetical protein
MSKPRKPFRAKQEDLMPVQGILGKIFNELDLEKKSIDYMLMLAWSDYASKHLPETISKATKAHRISKDRKLVISVKSAVVIQELQFLKTKMEKDFLKFTQDFPNKINGLVFESRS